jgi:hypothetical protein
MTYRENGDTITIEMSRFDYNLLMMILGIASGRVAENEHQLWSVVEFTNRLNTGNPRFIPYYIPPEFQTSDADRT